MAKYLMMNGVMTKVEERQEDAVSEKFRELLKKARSISKELGLTYDDETCRYDIVFGGQVYQAGVDAESVPKVLEKAGEALAKCGIVRMLTFEGFDPTNVKELMEFSAWAADQHKIIATAFAPGKNNTTNLVVTYVPKGWYEILRKKAEYEAQEEEDNNSEW